MAKVNLENNEVWALCDDCGEAQQFSDISASVLWVCKEHECKE